MLDLRQNAIRTIHKKAFDDIPNIEEILLGTNELTKIPNGMFLKNRKLKLLSLPKNRLKTIEDNAFRNQSIDTLNLRSNQFSFLPDKCFRSLKVKHKVYLTNNNFSCDCDLVLRLHT